MGASRKTLPGRKKVSPGKRYAHFLNIATRKPLIAPTQGGRGYYTVIGVEKEYSGAWERHETKKPGTNL